jgi:hypothetical protein
VRCAPVTNTMINDAIPANASPGTGPVHGRIALALVARLS